MVSSPLLSSPLPPSSSQGLCAILDGEGRGGGGLDREHGRGEAVLPGAAEGQLHHRQPERGLRTSLLTWKSRGTTPTYIAPLTQLANSPRPSCKKHVNMILQVLFNAGPLRCNYA